MEIERETNAYFFRRGLESGAYDTESDKPEYRGRSICYRLRYLRLARLAF